MVAHDRYATVRVDGALKGSALSRTGSAPVMLLPLPSLLCRLTLSHRATMALRAAGDRVGFLGTGQRPVGPV